MSDLQSLHRTALEHARQGRWDEAHTAVQAESDTFSAHIHAYLHRVEGDPGNAAYWYRKAGVPIPDASLPLQEELERLMARTEDTA